MKMYVYTMTQDTGFAPNPFWGYCTLATCKPQIRRSAKIGDWVVGTGSASKAGRGQIVFAMKVDEVLDFQQYNLDPRFEVKKPNMGGSPQQRCGDNIYYKDTNSVWRQRASRHNVEHMKQDMGGENVLVAKHFYYFGRGTEQIPAQYADPMLVTRGHRCNIAADLRDAFLDWLQTTYEPGLHGLPWDFDATAGCTRIKGASGGKGTSVNGSC